MSIPIIAFLYLYLLFVLVWLVFSVIALYHIIRYGQIGFTSLAVTLIYILVSTAILFLSYQYLSQIDWEASLTVFQGGVGVFGSSNF